MNRIKNRKRVGTLSHVSELIVVSFHMTMIMNKVTEFGAKLLRERTGRGESEHV